MMFRKWILDAGTPNCPRIERVGSVLVPKLVIGLQSCPKLVIGRYSVPAAPMLLKQHRGVTIEKRRAAKRTAMRSALLCGGVSGNFEGGD